MKSKLLLAALLIAANAFSQDSIFQIKDYKFRTPGFWALGLNVNFSGNYSNINQANSNNYRSNSTNLGPISANYYHIRSSDRRFQQSNISLSTSFSSYSRKDGSEKNDNSYGDSRVFWSLQTRDYRNNQWFLEWGNDVRSSVEAGKMQTPFYHTQSTEYSLQNIATVGFGKGRIEWVQDAQMAVYILQDLASQNLLNRTPSAAESNAFAQLITDVNNRRVFDSRRRRVYELTRIDSFLKNSGLATQTDIRHFTTVNDNWAFAINPFRRSGAAWFVRVKPGISFDQNRVTDKMQPPPFYNQANRLSLFFSPEIGYENYRPLSLKWQRNFSINASYKGYQQNDKFKEVRPAGGAETKTDAYSGSLSLQTNYGVGFFPNTRTQITADLGFFGGYHNSKSWNLQPSFDLLANYFIGYRTYFTGQLSTSYRYSKFGSGSSDFKADYFSGSFSVRLTHFLF